MASHRRIAPRKKRRKKPAEELRAHGQRSRPRADRTPRCALQEGGSASPGINWYTQNILDPSAMADVDDRRAAPPLTPDEIKRWQRERDAMPPATVEIPLRARGLAADAGYNDIRDDDKDWQDFRDRARKLREDNERDFGKRRACGGRP